MTCNAAPLFPGLRHESETVWGQDLVPRINPPPITLAYHSGPSLPCFHSLPLFLSCVCVSVHAHIHMYTHSEPIWWFGKAHKSLLSVKVIDAANTTVVCCLRSK